MLPIFVVNLNHKTSRASILTVWLSVSLRFCLVLWPFMVKYWMMGGCFSLCIITIKSGTILIFLSFQGLSDLILEPQPNFCIVSNGADVILLDRELYMQHANDVLRNNLRQEVRIKTFWALLFEGQERWSYHSFSFCPSHYYHFESLVFT